MKRTIAAVVLFLAGFVAGCYATTGGPVQSCAANPYQEGCAAPLNDDPPDWYLNGTKAPDGGADGARPEAGR